MSSNLVLGIPVHLSGYLRMLRRSLGNFVAISRGRLAGESYVPEPKSAICIETSQRCNLACRFCAYPKRGAGPFMADEAFRNAVRQALDYGSDDIWLTPMLGEVFADPDWRAKFAVLESAPGVRRFSFFTNFIMPSPAAVRELGDFSKLASIHISIYGHATETFQSVTRRPQAQYDRLIANLEALADVLGDGGRAPDIHLGIRTVGGVNGANLPNTPLVQLLRRLSDTGRATLMVNTDYDNWGGTVTNADVDEIGTRLVDGRGIYMRGACQLLFCTPQISAEGDVRACACRDTDGSLTIGNINDRPLKEIHAWSNPTFRRIVEDQEAGLYSANCRSCSMYRSIYDGRSAAGDPRWPIVTLATAKIRLGASTGKDAPR